MDITLNMLIHRLFIIYPELEHKTVFEKSSKPIHGIRMLSSAKKTHPEGYLYLCRDNHPIIKQGIPKDLLLVCVSRPGNPTVNASVFIQPQNMETDLVFNAFWDIFMFYRDWEYEMNHSIIQNNGIQNLIDLSEKVVGNPMTVIDTSMVVLAKSKTIQSEDPIFARMQPDHLVPEDSLHVFEQEHYYKDLKKLEIRYSNKSDSIVYDNVILALRSHDRTAAHLTMICEHYPYDSVLEIVSNLVGFLTQQLAISLQNKSTGQFVFENLMVDLLEEGVDKETIKDRLAILELPIQTDYCLMRFETDSEEHLFPEYFSRHFSILLAQAKTMLYEDGIIALIDLRRDYRKSGDTLRELTDRVRNELKKREIKCGISDVFTHLADIKVAYNETTAALEIGAVVNAGYRVYQYESIKIYDVIKAGRTTEDLIRICSKKLLDIYRQDQKHQTNLHNILRTYISCDRKYTVAAEMLHMHRNNVVYHIGRMVEQYDIDLDNVDERLYLTISFLVLDLVYAEI